MTSSTKIYTSFGGADFVAVLNNKVIGEWHGYEYTENLGVIFDEIGTPTNKGRFKGHMDVAVFNEDSNFRKALKPCENEFTIFFGNEYGQKSVIEFENIEFTERKGSISVDDTLMYEKYFFKADNITMSSKTWTYDLEKRQYFIEEGDADGEEE